MSSEQKQQQTSSSSPSPSLPASPAQVRLQRELLELVKNPPAGISIDTSKIKNWASKNGQWNSRWVIDVNGAVDTLYDGEKFELQFTFGPKFPFESPEVIFIGSNIPVHPHIYSNGHICLSILADEWSPALGVGAVCLSILSMLSSCTEKKRPDGDANYVKTCRSSPKHTSWLFHDDTV